MRFHFTEEQEAFRREVRDFLREEQDASTFAPNVGELVGRPSLEFSRKLAKRGWIGMTWPSQYGGQGRVEGSTNFKKEDGRSKISCNNGAIGATPPLPRRLNLYEKSWPIVK
jgi:alkylation response protein AidB-like acyl-CoA dehydrogenase